MVRGSYKIMKKKTKTKPKKKVIAKKKVAKKKKTSLKKKVSKPSRKIKSAKPIGSVTHFYNEISVAIVRFKEDVPAGTVLHFKGATTDFKQPAASMQFNHAPVAKAPKGKQIGIKVKKRVREGDAVHRVNK
jgi:hypothetical protein